MVLFMGSAAANTSSSPQLVLTSWSLQALPVIRIGASLQMDCCSTLSRRGRELLRSWRLLVEYVNDVRGGLSVAGTKHRLELTILGDYSDASRTEFNVRAMLHSDIRLFLGPFGSGQSGHAAHVINSSSDALLMATAASATSVFRGRPRIFGTFSPGATYFRSAVAHLASLTSAPRSAALLVEDYGPSVGWGQGARADLVAFGFDLISDVTVDYRADGAALANVVADWKTLFESRAVRPILLLATYDVTTCTRLATEASRQRLPRQLLVFSHCVDYLQFAELDVSVRAYVAGIAPWVWNLGLAQAHDPWSGASAADYRETFQQDSGFYPGYVAAGERSRDRNTTLP